jgi:hypothetical protein
MHQQRLGAQVTTPSDFEPTNQVLVVTSLTYPKHPALHADRPHTPIASNHGALTSSRIVPQISRSDFEGFSGA